eukprot:gnl/TRDRNA2_/TRDRNA2_151557_c0_seq6.p1 gnl/TRDRNA2_/TRDRNA2_151557_c0~~gnl/TRDRNA2_/TRDRNA2_151557_c0_seq6.p1  ORF type:complete len:421 (+),score=49.66 gnl/TRDRNA2_/TRDRNA2_151557_c0_seq6:33-1265(+)
MAAMRRPLYRNGRRAWIIADMDSTLLERPPSGLFPALTESPCFAPLVDWLQLGGGLCVVTTAARRSIKQVWDCFPPELRAGRSVVLSALEGADLVYGGDAGELVQDEKYLTSAASGGGPTCFAGDTLSTLLSHAESMVHSICADMAVDDSIRTALSRKYHGTYAAVLDRIRAGEALKSVLTRQMLVQPGAIMTETNERLISFNTPILSERIECQDLTQELVDRSDTGRGPRVCSISVMGFPASHSAKYFEPYIQPAASLGAHLSAAPNSLWFTPSGVSKATPIAWMKDRAADYAFDLENAVAFGDCPHSNDGPLTRLPLQCSEVPGDAHQYCPFISVASEQDFARVPAHVQDLHVGGMEHGTAFVIKAPIWLEDAAICIPQLLPAVVQQCQQDSHVRAGEQRQTIDGRDV